MNRIVALVVLLLGCVACPPRAIAQEAPSESHDAEARSLFDAGALAFSEGRFEEAYERFQSAYELSRRAVLLYNVGAAADRAGHDAEALEAYEAYVEGVPDAENRAYVEARVAVLRSRVSAEVAERTVEEVDAVDVLDVDEVPEVPPSSPDPGLAIGLFSVAGAAGITAIVTGVLGASIRSELETSCPMHTCSDPTLRGRADEMASLGIATDVLAGSSLVFAVGGLLAAILTPSGNDTEVAVGPGSFSVRVAF